MLDGDLPINSWIPYPGNGSNGGINKTDLPNARHIPFSYIGIQDGIPNLDDNGLVPTYQLPPGLPSVIDPPLPDRLGGLFSNTPVATKFGTAINTSGNLVLAQPTVPDIDGFGAGVIAVSFASTAPSATTQRTAPNRAGDWFNVKDYVADPNNCLNGTVDDTAAWLAVVAAANAAGGGTITAPYGCVSLITADILVTHSNIRFELPSVTIKMSGSTIVNGIYFQGSTTIGVSLSANVLAYSSTLTCSDLHGATAGAYIAFRRAAPVPTGLADLYSFVGLIRTITGTGPFTIQLNTVIPFSIDITDVTLLSFRLVALENVGVSGGVTFDGTAITNAALTHGIEAFSCVKSIFREIKGKNLSNGSILFAFWGQNNIYENIDGLNCGSQSNAAVQLNSQSNCQINHVRLEQSTGFGVVLPGWCYGTGTGFVIQGCFGSGRGFKLQASLFNNFSNFQSHFNHSNGVAVAVASCYNNFTNISANGNLEFEGVWLSDQNNCNNNFFGISAFNNTSRDLYIGTTDLNNSFFALNIGVLENHTSTTSFFTAGQPPNVVFPHIEVDGTTPSWFGSDTLATSNIIRINSAAGQARTIRFETASLPRWTITANATAETGGNAGSDFIIGRDDDSGTPIDTPFTILRSDGTARFSSSVRIGVGFGIFGNAIVNVQPTVSGSLIDLTSTGALHSLLAQMASFGWFINSTTP